MTRDDIIERHYGKARGEMAIVFALLPIVVAIFVIVFAASIGRPRAGGMLFALLCAAPLLLLRDKRLGNNPMIAYAVGLLLPGLAGFLATAEAWVTAVTALLGAASVWLFYRKRNDTNYQPKLNTTGQTNMNADLTAAGFDEMSFPQ